MRKLLLLMILFLGACSTQGVQTPTETPAPAATATPQVELTPEGLAAPGFPLPRDYCPGTWIGARVVGVNKAAGTIDLSLLLLPKATPPEGYQWCIRTPQYVEYFVTLRVAESTMEELEANPRFPRAAEILGEVLITSATAVTTLQEWETKWTEGIRTDVELICFCAGNGCCQKQKQ